MYNGRRDGQSRDSMLTTAVQTAVYHTIFIDPTFTIDMPKISPEMWDRVCVTTPENVEENERLEFLGDQLMDACIGIDLYRNIPDGTPHKYTILLGVLHSNRTFCELAEKMNLHKGKEDQKTVGDIFEAIIGAYYTEKGFDAVYAWASRVYETLVQKASTAFDDCLVKLGLAPAPIPGPSNSADTAEADGSSGKGKGKGRRRSSAAQAGQSFPLSPRSPSIPIPTSTAPSQSTSPQEERTSVDDERDETPLHSSSARSDNDNYGAAPSPEDMHYPRASSTASHAESSDDEDPLPEFWEKIRMSDGRTIFVNHQTETTTWDDPRHTHRQSPSPDLHSTPEAWTARLMAGAPDVPSGHPSLHGPTPFPELLEEGYTQHTSGDLHLNELPEFWEELQGEDGAWYYVDHKDATIIKKRT